MPGSRQVSSGSSASTVPMPVSDRVAHRAHEMDPLARQLAR